MNIYFWNRQTSSSSEIFKDFEHSGSEIQNGRQYGCRFYKPKRNYKKDAITASKVEQSIWKCTFSKSEWQTACNDAIFSTKIQDGRQNGVMQSCFYVSKKNAVHVITRRNLLSKIDFVLSKLLFISNELFL